VSGHWHEYVNGQYSHCYIVSDSSIAVNYLLYEYLIDIEKEDGKALLYSFAIGMDKWISDYIVKSNVIHINDTIDWIKVNDSKEVFLDELSSGLMLSIVPDSLSKARFSKRAWRGPEATINEIYIGKLKEQFKTASNISKYNYDGYYIQVAEVLIDPEGIPMYIERHHDLENKWMVIIHADKHTPAEFFDSIYAKILEGGYNDSNIYRTVVDEKNRALGIYTTQKLPPTIN
jgi:hypothetical protein